MKRNVPLKRSGFKPAVFGAVRSDSIEPKPAPGPRKRKCKSCKTSFTPFRPLEAWCSPECAVIIAKDRLAAQERKIDRAKKQALKTLPQLLKEAQIEFNRFIKLRDRLAGYPCVSSGRPLDWSGNAVDAGHMRSVGSAPHLRFNEDNVHAQSKHDNLWKSGNVVEYRINLIARIGLERVEALENNNAVHKWTKDEVRAIRDQYRIKANQLSKELK